MRLISKTEFARERGVHPSRVSQWLRDGRISEAEGGKIDADAAHERLGGSLDQAKGIRREGNITSTGPAPSKDLLETTEGEKDEKEPGAATSRDDSGYWEHKARREKAEAQLAEMKAMQAAGALVPAAAVRKEFAEIARSTRNAMLSIADRVAPVLDPANPARAHKLLSDEIGKALRELSARLEQRAAADTGAAEPATALQ